MKAVVVLVLLAFTAQAAEPDAGTILDVERARVVLPSGQAVEVGSGCYLDERACVAAGRRAAGETAENKALKDAVPTVSVVTIALLVGVAVGFAGGAAVAIWVAHR